ncbi:MAG: hypothetical protein H7Y09_06900 [Chitinophagaceae bacterium]|nr:hypothetical protein [Anaerolineae bacterium]
MIESQSPSLKRLFNFGSYRPLFVVDVMFSTILLAIAGIPLIILRDTRWFYNGFVMSGLLIVWLIVCVVWLVIAKRLEQPVHLTPTIRAGYGIGKPRSFVALLVIVVGLIIFTVVAFYIPMRQHYWIGMDEPVLIDAQHHFWYDYYDTLASRPFSALSSFVSGKLTPNSLEGYLLFSFVSRFMVGLMIYSVLGLVLPRSNGLPLIAAVLFIVNPSEQLRFATIFMNTFYGGMLVTTGAMFLFLLSYRHAWRWLLVIACILEGVALLHYEAVFFITLYTLAFIPLMGWRRRAWSWCYVWLGVMTLCALRFILFLKFSKTAYQIGYSTEIQQNLTLEVFFKNLSNLFSPLFSFFTSIESLPQFGVYGLIALLLIVFPLWVAARRTYFTPLRKTYLIGIAVGFLCLLMSIAPWLIIPIPNVPDLVDYPTLRYEFIASLPQSVLWALSIGLIGTFLARRFQRVWGVGATALLVMFAVSNAYDLQSHNGYWNPAVDFETVSSIFQQTNNLMPPLQPDSTIFFALDENVPSPFGWTYHVQHMTCLFFGVPGYQGKISDVPSWYVRGLAGYPEPPEYYLSYALHNVVLFRVSRDGQVTLEPTPELPPAAEGSLPVQPCVVPKTETTPGEPLPYLLNNP